MNIKRQIVQNSLTCSCNNCYFLFLLFFCFPMFAFHFHFLFSCHPFPLEKKIATTSFTLSQSHLFVFCCNFVLFVICCCCFWFLSLSVPSFLCLSINFVAIIVAFVFFPLLPCAIVKNIVSYIVPCQTNRRRNTHTHTTLGIVKASM